MWVLDTNTLIYFFKGEGRVAKKLLERLPVDIAIPAIVLYELRVGIAKSSSPEKRAGQLAEFTAAVQVLPLHQREAHASADLRAALENGATLVSRNTRGFGRIRNLRVEDWY